MKINNINKFIVLVPFLFCLISCVELEETPVDFISPSNYYNSEADAEASVTGVYQTLTSGGIYNVSYLNLLNISGCIGYTNDKRYTYLMTGDHMANGAFIQGSWDALYEGIRKANTTIDNVPSINMDEQKKSRIIAEAKFIRALYYFNLVRTWGPVPMPISTNQDLFLPASSIEEVYTQIISDLDDGIANLGNKGDYEPGRATKAAAQSLLAKVYLTMASAARSASTGSEGCALYSVFESDIDANYQKTKDLCNTVITGSSYSLLPDWMSLWGIENKINNEFIFSTLSKTDDDNTGTVLATRYTPPYSPYLAWGGQFGGLTYDFVKSYNPNDVRFTDGLIWEFNDTRNGKKIVWKRNLDNPTKLNAGSYWTMCNKKYTDVNATTYNGGCSYPIIRMADIYLMYAEAENEINGPNDEALAKINAIRTRVNLEPFANSDIQSKEDLRNKILDERMWELALEAQDWFDCVRTGTLEERCYNLSLDRSGKDPADSHPRERTSKNYLLPYPELEIITNTNMSQRSY